MTPDQEPTPRAENHLAGQASPYLRAHAQDPVAWVPWGERALRFARRANRPLLISVGYQACHWCHVMQRESFADPDIAGFINRHFVPVKVDREARPDVDALYMAYVNLSTGSGGWPMTVFATPDGLPFYGGTYFPSRSVGGASSFAEVLDAILHAWTLGRTTTLRTADEALETIRESQQGAFGTIDRSVLDAAAGNLYAQEDAANGGFGSAPKFPQAPAISFLTAYARLTGESRPADIARRQVLAMLRGGSYDQVGGGLFRYSTDAGWLVPHFEKMLYDQALLLSSIAQLYALEPSDELAHYARMTGTFLTRELAREDGGFFSALDAESDGIEGGHYLWSVPELESLLSAPEIALARDVLGVPETADSTERSVVLTRRAGRGPDADEVDALLAALAAARATRSGPARIGNVITSWNALTARGLIEAGAAIGDTSMITAGTGTLTWLFESVVRRDEVLHLVDDDSIKDVRFLEDYAALTAACLSAYDATADKRHLDTAERLHSRARKRFDRGDDGFALCAGKTALPLDPLETADSPLPSGAALFAENEVRLARAGRGSTQAAVQALTQFGRTARIAPYLAGHALAVAASLQETDGRP